MRILSIETSCDETAIALLDIQGPLENPNIQILGNTLLSQIHLHEKYGGVYPSLAKREHEKNLPIILEETLNQAKGDLSEDDLWKSIDFITVTSGPGLEPALWTGITFAKGLGEKWNNPVVPANHMEGHIYSVLYGDDKDSTLSLPALALLVSGGHTELVHIKDFGEYEIIGRTLDDAVGEAFDKVARLLGLPYPGGPKISALAEKARIRKPVDEIKLPRPMIHSKDLNFSYSGLKTAVLYKVRGDNREDDIYKEDMARAFEDAAIEVLIDKTRRAIDQLGEIKTLITGGGVSANTHLGRELEKLILEFPEVALRLPSKLLTTDNAIMIGISAFVKVTKNKEILKDKTPIVANGNLSL